MAVGVATANSILLVTFANDERLEGKDHVEAALSAGITRIRPVLMTASAMIIGMLPMALALGEGGAQNAPLGRAVIGGLLFATFSTLFFVPIVYSFLRVKPPVNQDRVIEEEAHQPLDLDYPGAGIGYFMRSANVQDEKSDRLNERAGRAPSASYFPWQGCGDGASARRGGCWRVARRLLTAQEPGSCGVGRRDRGEERDPGGDIHGGARRAGRRRSPASRQHFIGFGGVHLCARCRIRQQAVRRYRRPCEVKPVTGADRCAGSGSAGGTGSRSGGAGEAAVGSGTRRADPGRSPARSGKIDAHAIRGSG